MIKRFSLIPLAFFTLHTFAAVPSEALTFGTNIQLVNSTAARETKVRSAEELIKKVIGSEAFRTAVLNHTYNGATTFANNNGLTNSQIYTKILEASEELNPGKNNIMDLTVEFYYNAFTSTVGYTSGSVNKIYSNTKYFDAYTPSSVANNFTHEWLHKLGFDHDSAATAARPYSVPYGVGTIMEHVARSGNFDSVPSTTTGAALVAPTNLALSISGTSVSLKWSAAAGAAKYTVYRRLAGSTTTYLQGTVTALSYLQAAPTTDATYYVRSVDAQGATLKSAEVLYKKASTPTPSTPPASTDAWTTEFMNLINNHRASIGLSPLTHVAGLAKIVTTHSEEMATHAVAFGHDGFSTRCADSRTVLGGGNWCGENVAMGQTTPQAAYTSWMNSPGHKANIENTRATHTGFGYAKSSSGTYYWTQIFLQGN